MVSTASSQVGNALQIRHRAGLRLLWPVGLLLVVSAALLFGLLRNPPPRTIDLGTAGDTPFVTSFFARERDGATSFRWTTSGSRLQLHGAVVGPLRLELRFHGDAVTATHPRRMYLQRAGQTMAQLEIEPGWRVYQVLLPEEGQPRPLDLIISEYRSAPRDPRLLGVPIDWMKVTPAAGATLPVGTALRQTLRLTWALALLAGTFGLINRAVWPDRRALTRLLWVCVPVSIAAAGLIFWAGHDPYTLAWATSAATGLLLPATVALAGLLLWNNRQAVIAGVNPARRVAVAPAHLLTALVLLLHLLLLLPLPTAGRGMVALLLPALPGVLLALLLFRVQEGPLMLLFLGVCGGLLLPALLLLALQALPGAVPGWGLLLATDALILLIGWALFRRTMDPGPAPARVHLSGIFATRHLPLALLLLLGAAFRLTFLGNAEFQGDEARALLKAVGMLHGQEEILLLHKKGPMEVLLPALPLALTNHVNEWVARLPFALAGMGVLLGSYALARDLFVCNGRLVGLPAVAILALDGFLIAFARIVQYQSIVMLMSLGAIVCGWRFYAGAAHPRRYLAAAAVLAAVGLLAHYDAIFVLPALGWLLLAGGRRRNWRPAQWLRELTIPALLGAGLLFSFFVPFALNARFGRTFEYVVGRTGQDNAGVTLVNNLVEYYHLATFYNTTFQMQWLGVTLAAGLLVWLLQYLRPRRLAGALAGLLLVGCLLLLLRPAWFEPAGSSNWAILAFGLPLAGLLPAPGTPAGLRVLLLWFGAAFVAQAFLIVNPKTHFYTIDIAGALLIGLALTQLVGWLRRQRAWLIRPLVAGGGALLLLTIPYLYLVYIRPEPEYWTVFPEARPAIYRAGYGDQLPNGGYFGFPRRAGWKVIGDLYRQGVLQGDYASNEKELITGWYTRGTLRCRQEPDYYFAAWSVASSTLKIDVPPGYHLLGSVLVDDVKKLDIYSREPVAHPPRIFTLAEHRAAFDAQPITSFPIQRALVEVVPQQHLDARWQPDVMLRGYDLDRTRLEPGETATLVLYWRENLAIEPGYLPVVTLVDADGKSVAQATPACDVLPAAWNTQYLSGVAFTLTNTAQIPPGQYALQVGLRHTQTGEWLPREDGAHMLPFAQLLLTAP
ncbi:MAG: ArnT family glycosyltransferase [Chloroflexaceae bacterium]